MSHDVKKITLRAFHARLTECALEKDGRVVPLRARNRRLGVQAYVQVPSTLFLYSFTLERCDFDRHATLPHTVSPDCDAGE